MKTTRHVHEKGEREGVVVSLLMEAEDLHDETLLTMLSWALRDGTKITVEQADGNTHDFNSGGGGQ